MAKTGTRKRVASDGVKGGDWPYHMNRNTKKMVRCKSNPCSRHKQGEDVMAASLEDAYRKYNQGNDASGLSSDGDAVAHVSRPADPRAVLMAGIKSDVAANDPKALSAAMGQMEDVASDPRVPDDRARDYASYLATALNLSSSHQTAAAGPDRDVIRSAELAVNSTRLQYPGFPVDEMPARFVLSDAESEELSDQPIIDPHDPDVFSVRANPTYLLRHFGRGEVASAAALGAMMDPAPGEDHGRSWMESLPWTPEGPDDGNVWMVPRPDDDGEGEGRKPIAVPHEAMVEAARHTWGGMLLKGATGHALLYGTVRTPDGLCSPEERAQRDVIAGVNTMLADGDIPDMLTARDYETMYPVSGHMPGGPEPEVGIVRNGQEHDPTDFMGDDKVLATYSRMMEESMRPLGGSAFDYTARDLDLMSSYGAPLRAQFSLDGRRNPFDSRRRRQVGLRLVAASNALHVPRGNVGAALGAWLPEGDQRIESIGHEAAAGNVFARFMAARTRDDLVSASRDALHDAESRRARG